MKGYFEKCYDHDKEYDAVGRRGEVVIDFGNINGKLSKANSTLSRKPISGLPTPDPAFGKYLASKHFWRTVNKSLDIADLINKKQVSNLHLQVLKCQRDFNYQKIADIDHVLDIHKKKPITPEELIEKLKTIIYHKTSERILIKKNGQLVVKPVEKENEFGNLSLSQITDSTFNPHFIDANISGLQSFEMEDGLTDEEMLIDDEDDDE